MGAIVPNVAEETSQSKQPISRSDLMNRFKVWLIRKLGGYVYLEEKVVYKTLPCITANFEVALMPGGWHKVISEEEELKLAEKEAANKIGKYIIDNKLCEVLRSHDDNFNCDRLRYVLRVIEPPKN